MVNLLVSVRVLAVADEDYRYNEEETEHESLFSLIISGRMLKILLEGGFVLWMHILLHRTAVRIAEEDRGASRPVCGRPVLRMGVGDVLNTSLTLLGLCNQLDTR